MDLTKKLEEIRQKPEHIRLRYVWFSVAISMFFIIIIWIFSINESFKNVSWQKSENLPDIKQSIENIKSAQDSISSMKNEINSSISNQEQQNQDNQKPQENISDQPDNKPITNFQNEIGPQKK